MGRARVACLILLRESVLDKDNIVVHDGIRDQDPRGKVLRVAEGRVSDTDLLDNATLRAPHVLHRLHSKGHVAEKKGEKRDIQRDTHR